MRQVPENADRNGQQIKKKTNTLKIIYFWNTYLKM